MLGVVDSWGSFANLGILSMVKQITNYVQIPFYGTRYASLYDDNFPFLGASDTPVRPIPRDILVPCIGCGAENQDPGGAARLAHRSSGEEAVG